MSIESLRFALPAYAKDLKLNLGSLMNETILTEQQKYGCLLACAHALGQPEVLRASESEAEGRLTPEARTAARSAAAIMAMNNVYYRAVHLLSNQVYASLPARLRMNVIAYPGVEKADFELFSLAVSAVNAVSRVLAAEQAA